MPYYYFDSTALVKRYSMERGTRVVNKLMVKAAGKVAILPMECNGTVFRSCPFARSREKSRGMIVIPCCTSSRWKPRKGLFQFISRRWRPISPRGS